MARLDARSFELRIGESDAALDGGHAVRTVPRELDGIDDGGRHRPLVGGLVVGGLVGGLVDDDPPSATPVPVDAPTRSQRTASADAAADARGRPPESSEDRSTGRVDRASSSTPRA